MKKGMFATVRRYEGVPDPAAAAEQVEKKFVPFISSLPGFIEYYWIDLTGGAMLSITIFKSLSEAIAANNKSRDWVREHLSAVLPHVARSEAGAIVAYKGLFENV